MREINVDTVRETVKKLFIEANYFLPEDISALMKSAAEKETCSGCAYALKCCIENEEAAKELNVPICQDTGMAVVFMEIGQDVHFTGGLLRDAVNKGVSEAYIEGYMRCSVVGDPLERKNTGDNTPAIIYTEIVEGDKVKIIAAPKGFGSENMSALKMFNPSATDDDIVKFIVDSVENAGSKPCPPVVIGIGLGGDFEYSAMLAKKALIRNSNVRNPKSRYADLEKRILDEVNKTGIGAQGFGGDITALAVNIEEYPTHIAGLPVALNMGCHVTRHKSCVI